MYSASYLGSTATLGPQSNFKGSSATLGASVQSIPDYVVSQLSTPSAVSPEGKKLQQDICVLSTRGKVPVCACVPIRGVCLSYGYCVYVSVFFGYCVCVCHPHVT